VSAGLDPAIGLVHPEQYRRPSLALDLVEEFRPLIVDQVVIPACVTCWSTVHVLGQAALDPPTLVWAAL
jgi:hypothetical protein